VLASLRYMYTSLTEELPGTREVVITVSDGSFTTMQSVFIMIRLVLNSSPVLLFGGERSTVFVEETDLPLPVGMYHSEEN